MYKKNKTRRNGIRFKQVLKDVSTFLKKPLAIPVAVVGIALAITAVITVPGMIATSTTETLQEILEVNPNAKKKAEVVDTTPSSYEWTAEEENTDEKL